MALHSMRLYLLKIQIQLIQLEGGHFFEHKNKKIYFIFSSADSKLADADR
jgi:hypothetical protein